MITVGMNSHSRLGNQMWGYAMLRSVAERNGYKWYYNPKEWLGHSLFDCDLGEKDGNIQQDFFELPGQQFNPEVFNVKDFTCLQGYWQSAKYFKREDVKEWFWINPSRVRECLELSPYQFKTNTCFINVRGTDQKLPHLTLDMEYYETAMRIMRRFRGDMEFVVVTDDPEFGAKYFPSLLVLSNSRDVDFCLMRHANYVIGAISTFAWWACYLNDYNVAIFPKYFYHHKTQGVEGCSGWGPMDIHTHKFIWI